MRSHFIFTLFALAGVVLLSGCAVVASPYRAGVYVTPAPVLVSPVIVRPGRGYYGYGHWRRW